MKNEKFVKEKRKKRKKEDKTSEKIEITKKQKPPKSHLIQSSLPSPPYLLSNCTHHTLGVHGFSTSAHTRKGAAFVVEVKRAKESVITHTMERQETAYEKGKAIVCALCVLCVLDVYFVCTLCAYIMCERDSGRV